MVASLLVVIFNASALDNPHNINNSVNCGDCHITPLSNTTTWWTNQGEETGVCGQCHNAAALGSDVLTHSSSNTSTQYGTWDKKCTDCHNPHSQRQNVKWKTLSYLTSGAISTVTTTTLTKIGANWNTTDNGGLGEWAGMILIPNVSYQGRNHRIVSNTSDTITISTIGGDAINTVYAKTGNTFAIVYGKLVKEVVNGRYVKYFRQTGTNSFADGDGTIDGVCEVCHTQTIHFRNTGAGPDQSHANIGSGLGGSRCALCHSHTAGFKLSDEMQGITSGGCITCHALTLGSRVAVVGQLNGNSHHIQGVALTNTHCYQCHWEANSDGSINNTYHKGTAVDLVIYGAGSRPASYSLGTTAIQYSANGSRTEVQKINQHCIGCHSEQNNSTQPFGDGKTPKQYAWDGYSVGAKYTSANTTTWGKYTATASAAQKNTTKAYSAHGNAAANKEGWNSATGVDGVISDFTGNSNVACYDCHNSHGSAVSGTTTSYTSGTANGGIFKDTTANKGGYSMTYKPASGGSSGNKNAYNPGAGLCFDCHLTANSGTMPWGYSGTFGAAQKIMGYWDTEFFGPGTFGPQSRYAYKASLSHKGGHFGASSALSGSPSGTINGLCTPCHDPHGVSPALGANQQYAVPLLKGTWLTSPYKEDAAPASNTQNTVNDVNAGNVYHIDQNTFGTHVMDALTGISEDDTKFAGLCLNCHAKSQLTDGTNGGTWKSTDRIHESVKGWGANAKHKYSCSKCHTPHNSRLPRLMATNCLNTQHKGRTPYNFSPVLSGSGGNCWTGWLDPDYIECGGGSGHFPGSGSGTTYSYSVSCHENRTGNVYDQSWNTVTPWAEDMPIISSGPSAGSFTAVGINVQATITWGTSNSYSSSYVDYGLTPAYGSTTGNGTLVLNHSVTIQNLTNHSTYNYRVRSASGTGQETASGNNIFYISVPPTVPSLIAEADTICDPSCSVTLQWNASSDPDSGPIEYQVEVDTSSSFNTGNKQTSSWISATSWSPTLATNNTWYWQVKARDANHTEAVSGWSASDNFIMSDGIAPPQVTLTSPADTTGFADYYCGGSPGIGFSWNAVPPVAEYYVEVSTDSTFTTVNYPSGWILGASWSAGIAPGATYYWRVGARDPLNPGTVNWSATWSFTVTDYGCPSSCPLIFTWNGTEYKYISDMQGPIIGLPPTALKKNVSLYQPLYVVLDGLAVDQSNLYKLKLRESQAEITYMDELKLLTVDIPEGYQIAVSSAENTYNYGYVNPFKIYTIKDPVLPVSATDRDGNDILAAVMSMDSTPAPVTPNPPTPDFYTFDFGVIAHPENAKLLIDAWAFYGESRYTATTTIQPYIEVVDPNGQWVKVKSIGTPTGDMKTMVIDIANVFQSADQQIRINMGIRRGSRWMIDRIRMDDSAPAEVQVQEIQTSAADLQLGGMVIQYMPSLTGRLIASDEERPSLPANFGYGKFTKYGDVGELLSTRDDKYVIMRHGDKIDLTFPAPGQPSTGMTRRFILKGDLWYKSFGVTNIVEPLPFHGMSTYPYEAPEAYPTDPDHQQYILNYNTREFIQ